MVPPALNGIGFKATKSDLTSQNNFKYNIGQVYEHSGPLIMCESGFHLCKHLHYTFSFYNPRESRFFVVSYDNITGHCYEDDEKNGLVAPKVVTSAIRLDAEIKVEEHLEMSNMVKRYPTEHMVLYLERYGDSQNTKEVLKQLFAAGADVHADDDYALQNASYYGQIEVVRLLLEAEADVHARDDHLLRLASKYGHTEVVRLLLDYGADVHAWDDDALRWASLYGHHEVVRLLLEAGSNVHACDDEALREASYCGYADVVRLLLDKGADLHARDDQALREASKNGHTEVVRLLLDRGANVHAGCDFALIIAIQKGLTEVKKMLLDAAGDV